MPKGHYDRTGIDFSHKRSAPRFTQLRYKDMSWMDDGLCSGMDPDLFYPSRGANMNDVKAAKAICEECPVKKQCLDFALYNFEEHGIWGGTTERQRQKLRKLRNIKDSRLYVIE